MKKISSIHALMAIAVIATMVGSTAPLAYASDTPALSLVPPVPVIGGFPTIVVTGSAGTVPHDNLRFGLREPPSTGVSLTTVPPPSFTDCGQDRYLAGAGSYWILTTDGAAPSLANMVEIDLPVAGASASIPFAPGPVVIAYSGGATGPASGIWVDDNTVANKVPAIDFLATVIPSNPYATLICGFDNAGTPNVQPFQIIQDFRTQEPVAGEIIPINTTALLIAGISTSPMLVMVGLVAVASGIFTLLRFQVSQKNI